MGGTVSATSGAPGRRGQNPNHIDLVKNEWLAGYQVVVARVSLGSTGLQVDASDPSWEQVVRRPVDGLDPDADPASFFEHLPTLIHGTYLFATEPHGEDDCPYHDHLVVHMRSTSEAPSQTHAL